MGLRNIDRSLSVTSQMTRGALSEIRDQIRQPLYDSVTMSSADDVAANPTYALTTLRVDTYQFFTSIQNKTLDETNMTQAGQLEIKTSFLVQGFRMEYQQFYPDNEDILGVLVNNSSIGFWITEKNFLTCPLSYAGGKIKQWAGANANFHAGKEIAQPILMDANAALSIEPNQSFRVDWEIDEPQADADLAVIDAGVAEGTTARFYCYILGIMRRRVQ